MESMTVGKLKANFSEVLEQVQQGEEFRVLYGRARKPVAILCPIKDEVASTKRPIGLFDGVWKAHITDDFKFKSTEEFLGLE